MWNFLKLLSYTRSRLLHGGNVVRVLFHFVLTAAHFHRAWVAASISYFLTLLQNCHVVLPTKKCLHCCLSVALDLCLPLSRWALLTYCLVSLILCPPLALFSKLVDMKINLSLILQTTQIQKQFLLSIFVFIDSLVVSALQHSGGYATSRQPRRKNLYL